MDAHKSVGLTNSAVPFSILRLPAVRARTGLSRSTIYLGIARGIFPKPISIGIRSVGWIDAEIEQWLSSRIAASRVGGLST